HDIVCTVHLRLVQPDEPHSWFGPKETTGPPFVKRVYKGTFCRSTALSADRQSIGGRWIHFWPIDTKSQPMMIPSSRWHSPTSSEHMLRLWQSSKEQSRENRGSLCMAVDFRARLSMHYIGLFSRGQTFDISSAACSIHRFQYMAISDGRQRIMPTPQDREAGLVLDYPEAVLLTNPSNPELNGEVDDKYQYSCDDKDNRVHGWICSNPAVAFWMITPNDEFRTGSPVKQDLTSHVGPTTLSMFFSTHYAGDNLTIKLRDGEPWKKVFGPILIYLNSVSVEEDALTLWEDAKEQMLIETQSWPYDFPLSEDFPHADQRGTVSGRLLVRDKYINEQLMTVNFAFVGLAALGNVGSWQRENKFIHMHQRFLD
ncbi:hypothetical protein HYC85_022561, partial [Camellia sinensis]